MHIKFFSENNQRIYFYDNGYAASRICNRYSHGVEVLVFRWKPREPTFWEKVQQKLGLVKEWESEPFYYSHIEDVEEDLVGLKNWSQDMTTYEYLNPDQEKQLMETLKKLPRVETTA